MSVGKKGAALIVTAGCLWGSIGLFIRWMADAGASAETVSFLRMAFAFVLLFFVTLVRSGPSAFRVSGRTLLCSAALGLVCHGAYNVFYSLAVLRIGVSVSAVLLNVAPVFTAVLSALFFRERMTARKCLCLAVNVFGCVLAATGGKFSDASVSVSGILFGVAAGLCYALTAIFGKLCANGGDPFVVSTYSYLFAALFLAVFVKPQTVLAELTPTLAGLGLLYALIPTAIGYVLYYRGVQQLTESSRAPVLASMETVTAALLGVLVLGETLSAVHVLGIAIVMASIALMQNTKKKTGLPA